MQRFAATQALILLGALLGLPASPHAELTLGPRVSFDHGYTYEAGIQAEGRVALALSPSGFLVTTGAYGMYAYRLDPEGRILDRTYAQFNPGWRSEWLYDISDHDGVSWKIVGGRSRDPERAERVGNLSLFLADTDALEPIGSEIPIVSQGDLLLPTICWTGAVHLISWVEEIEGTNEGTLWMVRVDANGIRLDPTPVQVTEDRVAGGFAVTADLAGGLVTWLTHEGVVRAARIDASGNPVGESIDLARTTLDSRPCLGAVRVGVRFFVGWSNGQRLRTLSLTPEEGVSEVHTLGPVVGDRGFVMAAHDSTVAITFRPFDYESANPHALLLRVGRDGGIEELEPSRPLDPERWNWSNYPPTWTARLDTDCLWTGRAFAAVWDFEPPIVVAREGGSRGEERRDCSDIPEEPALLQLLNEHGEFQMPKPLRVNPAWSVSNVLPYWDRDHFAALFEDSYGPGWLHLAGFDTDGRVYGEQSRPGQAPWGSSPCDTQHTSGRSLHSGREKQYLLHSRWGWCYCGGWDINSSSLGMERLDAGSKLSEPVYFDLEGDSETCVGWDLATKGDTLLLACAVERAGSGTRIMLRHGGRPPIDVRSYGPVSSPSALAFGERFLVAWMERREGRARIYGAWADPRAPNDYYPEGNLLLQETAEQATPNLVEGPHGEAILLYARAREAGGIEVRGARLSPEGVVVDPSGFSIATSESDNARPSGIWDGRNYVVFWAGPGADPGASLSLYANRVTRDGRMWEVQPLLVQRSGWGARSLATDGNGVVAVGTSGAVWILYDGESGPVWQSSPNVELCEGGVCLEWRGRNPAARSWLLRALAPAEGALPFPPASYLPVPEATPVVGVGPHAFVDRQIAENECYAYVVATEVEEGALVYSEPTRHCTALVPVTPALAVFPNPARGDAVITLAGIAPRGSAGAQVVSLSGRIVRRLSGDATALGFVRLPWDGRDERGRTVPAGVYWVRATVGGLRETRAIVILR